MPHWIALIPGTKAPLPCTEPAPLDARSLGWWCLQFTPRVALLNEAVVAELQASHRLFGGAAKLVQRMQTQAMAQGCQASAQAATASAALALARHHGHKQAPLEWCPRESPSSSWNRKLQGMLNALPLRTLPGVAAHEPTLARLGCRSLADVRALPRAGLSRRFGAGLLQALDQADGRQAEAFEWLTLPAVFKSRLELPSRVESAPEMGLAAAILLGQMCAWLTGHRSGVHAFTLQWQHDFFAPRDAGSHGQCEIRLANPSRDPTRLKRLLHEHLQRIQLGGPVGDISLHAHEISPLADDCRNLFPEISGDTLSIQPDALRTPAAQKAQQEALFSLMERLSARLGADHVQQGMLQADHRPELAQAWYPAPHGLPGKFGNKQHTSPPHPADLPQPCWLLKAPLPLSLSRIGPGLPEMPVYQGRLRLLAGPHRIEAGWWDDTPTARDYYLASSERAGLLWVFRERHTRNQPGSPWYLHGLFA
ncbi:MAG: DNA polymerase Y family protein [Burkholderiales bacterium]|nr:DNA polymerase Y family protein [Burkholderiales bacterium]